MSTPIGISPIVTRDEWLVARQALLAEEKKLTRAHEQLARQRPAPLGVKVESDGIMRRVRLHDEYEQKASSCGCCHHEQKP